MFSRLMLSRRFAALFWTQLFSALNDNFVKNALVILILFQIGADKGSALVTLAGAVFIAPFFLFSALGGELADKHDKALVAERLKRYEIPIAALAGVGFVLHSVPLLFVALFLFGSMGALFGPLKYGVLPEQLTQEELSAGNALVEGGTFLAILLGTIAGGYAMAHPGLEWIVAAVSVAMAVLCWLSARWMPASLPAAPEITVTRNPWVSTMALVRELRGNRRLWIGAQIVSWFWVVGSVSLSLLPALVKGPLGGTESVITLCLVVFTVGIAFGSGLAAWASEGRPNLALVPAGAFLMALFALSIGSTVHGLAGGATGTTALGLVQSAAGLWLLASLFGLAVAGGLFIVPAFAAVQGWADKDKRARVVAAVNILTAGYMAGAGLAVAILQTLGVGQVALWLGLGVANLGALILVLHAWGKDGARDLGQFIFRAFFRLDVKGMENIPADGNRVVIAPNHVSLLDGPLLHAILPGHAAFAIDSAMAKSWWVKPFLKLVNAYTMDPTRPLSTRGLINTVKAGQAVVIFPEGRITVTGGLMKVYDGTATIADKADAWVVPVRIEGLERSPLSYLSRTQTRKSLLPKVTVTILPARKLVVDDALRGKARRQAAGLALQDIMIDSAVETAPIDRTLFESLAAAHATRDTGKFAVEDPLGTKLTYRRLIAGAQVLGHKLDGLLPPVGSSVGLMLPTSAGAAVTFFAFQTVGRVPAMINFTAGIKSVLAACRAARVEFVVTSRGFVEKAKLEPLVAAMQAEGMTIVMLEDIRATIGIADKVRGLLAGSRTLVMREPGDPAVILFTSGSEGLPKGVVLSHRNLNANTAQSLTRIAANGEDKVFNVLPVFHSFGLTGGLLMPLFGGIPTYQYPSPLHYRIVPELIYGSNATILFGTDTFLNGYARAAHPYDLRSLRLIMAGAEAVKDRTRQIYMERFGVRILEGYGVTETAPVLAINTPIANRAGTVGRISPLMEYRLDHVPGVSGAEVPLRVGRLHVKGPNVMLGYYRAEAPGVLEAPADGWHDTGDIVEVDPLRYIAIKGRAKRFAKIGGEMVSLSVAEAIAAKLWPAVVSVVVSIPDARKGERLVLLIPDKTATREAFSRQVRAEGLSELNVPAEIRVVERVPLLGSGKPDYAAAAELVRAAAPPSLEVQCLRHAPTNDVTAASTTVP